ncbi:hypothetical protein OROMI_015709 [Orobanche minor]
MEQTANGLFAASTCAGVAAIPRWTPPPGYYFLPTGVELIKDYLVKKINNEPIPLSEISSVDIYEHSPDMLAETYPQLGPNSWYFFTPTSRKYRNGKRPNRTTRGGNWKATGIDTKIRFQSQVIGSKRALVYYEHGNKTDWKMHEYKVDKPPRAKTNPTDMRLDDWVLCRIYKKAYKSHENEDQDNVGNINHQFNFRAAATTTTTTTTGDDNECLLSVQVYKPTVGYNQVNFPLATSTNNDNNGSLLAICDHVVFQDYNPMVMINQNNFPSAATTTNNENHLSVSDYIVDEDYNPTFGNNAAQMVEEEGYIWGAVQSDHHHGISFDQQNSTYFGFSSSTTNYNFSDSELEFVSDLLAVSPDNIF